MSPAVDTNPRTPGRRNGWHNVMDNRKLCTKTSLRR